MRKRVPVSHEPKLAALDLISFAMQASCKIYKELLYPEMLRGPQLVGRIGSCFFLTGIFFCSTKTGQTQYQLGWHFAPAFFRAHYTSGEHLKGPLMLQAVDISRALPVLDAFRWWSRVWSLAVVKEIIRFPSSRFKEAL